jgi:hypothetical protein
LQSRYKALTAQERNEELKVLRKQLKVLNEVMNTRKELLAETALRESKLAADIQKRAALRKERRESEMEEKERSMREECAEDLQNFERLELLKAKIAENSHI